MRGRDVLCTKRNFKLYKASLQKELEVQTVTQKDEVKSLGNNTARIRTDITKGHSTKGK